MEELPVEIIELVLASDRLTIEDVLNFSSTCNHFRSLVLNSSITWKRKFLQRWPQLQSRFDSDFNDWYEELRHMSDLKCRSHLMLSTMSSRFYKKYELSDCDLKEWADLVAERPRNYEYLIMDLLVVVNTHTPIKSIKIVPVDTPGNKTFQYYATKVLRFVRQLHLMGVWREFIALPEKEQVLERAAVFIAQWCQPNVEIHLKAVERQLDEIAEQVKENLRIVSPKHPIFKASKETLEKWKFEKLDDNQWNPNDCKSIINALTTVLYQYLGYHGNNSAYYMPENSFINEVLDKRRGLPITLAIVYEGIARRLGLQCEPISFTAHFLLRFTEDKSFPFDCYYIDVFNKGDVVRKGYCPHSRIGPSGLPTELEPAATTRQVVVRMANNLEASGRQHTHPNGRITRLRATLELLQLVNPHDVSSLVSLARLYMLHNIDTEPLEIFLLSQNSGVPEQIQRIVNMLRDYEAHRKRNELETVNKAEPVARPENLKFAVGMVMRHLALSYKCVIYAWDPVCMATAEWQSQMGVHKLKFKHEQPFYNVLVEDGSHRYVAEENISPTANTGFLYLNEDIGRLFSHFFETHYVPNAEKEKEYPFDTDVRHMFYQKMQFGF